MLDEKGRRFTPAAVIGVLGIIVAAVGFMVGSNVDHFNVWHGVGIVGLGMMAYGGIKTF